MSFLDKIISPFVEVEEEKKVEETKTTNIASVTTANTANSNIVPQVENNSIIPPQFLEHFESLLKSTNFPGPDYYEFMITMKNMEKLSLSEKDKISASYAAHVATAPSDKAKPEFLVESALAYLNVLEKDKNDFEKNCEKKTDNEIGSLSKELSGLKAQNESFEKEILRLQMEISDNNKREKEIENEIEQKSEKINTAKNQYLNAHSLFSKKINQDILNIKTHLGANQ
jgi:hypothetical protein